MKIRAGKRTSGVYSKEGKRKRGGEQTAEKNGKDLLCLRTAENRGGYLSPSRTGIFFIFIVEWEERKYFSLLLIIILRFQAGKSDERDGR